MTQKTKRIAIWTGGSIAALVLLLAAAAILTLRSDWAREYVRTKIISTVEDSTGGRVELRAFRFSWSTLEAEIDDFIIHGLESSQDAPLFRAPRILVRLKLLAALSNPVDLRYLEVDQPSANIMVFPNGETNLPTPKAARKPGGKSGLETVVDLAIDEVLIREGSAQYLDRKIALDGHANHLLAQLQFEEAAKRYRGQLSIDPIVAASAGRPPLEVKLTVPLILERDKIAVSSGRIEFPQSKIDFSGELNHLSAPEISAQMNAHLVLAEFSKSLDLPIHPVPGRTPETLDAALSLQKTPATVGLQQVSITLGATHVETSGENLRGAIALDEIRQLFAIDSDNLRGRVDLAGKFSFTPGAIEVRDLSFGAFGGQFRANARLENLAKLTASVNLGGFDLQRLVREQAGTRLDYAGGIDGTLSANGDLKTKKFAAQAALRITPKPGGIPVSGRIAAKYSGDAVAIDGSQINLPSTRIDLAGELGRLARITVNSRNLGDLSPTIHGGPGNLTAEIRGPLTTPKITGNATASKFTISDRMFDRLSAAFSASPEGAIVSDASVARGAFEAKFNGSVGMQHWKPLPADRLTLDAATHQGDLADILALAGQTGVRATGALDAEAHITGTVGNPRGQITATAVKGMIDDEPYDRAQLSASLSDQRITLQSAQFIAGNARLDATGVFQHPRDSLEQGHVQAQVASNDLNLAQFRTLERRRPGLAGTATLNANIEGDLKNAAGMKFEPSQINGDLAVKGLRLSAQDLGSLTASVRTEAGSINTRVQSDFAGSSVVLNGRTKLAPDYPTSADATIRDLDVERLLAVVAPGNAVARGKLSATAHATGRLDNPDANVDFDLTSAVLYDEPITRLHGAADYNSHLVTLTSLQATLPAGRIDASGTMMHNGTDFANGSVELKVSAPALALQQLRILQRARPGLAGTARLTAEASAEIRNQQPSFSKLNVNGAVTDIRVGTRSFGDVNLTGSTQGKSLNVKLDSGLGKSMLHADAQVQLASDYPVTGKVTFANLTYSGLDGLLDAPAARDFDAIAEGEVNLSGPLRNLAQMHADLRLNHVEAFTIVPATASQAERRVSIQNSGPIVAHLDKSIVRIESAHVTGPSTDLNIAGTAALDGTGALNITAKGQSNLSIVQQFDRSLASSGNIAIDIAARGTLRQPNAAGQIELKDVTFNSADWPVGLSHANGVVALSGRTADIRNLAGQVGGGKVAVNGTVSAAGAILNYNIKTTANQVRIRSNGASIVVDAQIALSGTSTRSVMTGNVAIQQISYTSQSDIGTMLAGSANPVSTPTTGGPLANMRLNIRVRTAPGVRFRTSLAQELEAMADLNVRGTAASPGIVGRVNITRGTLVFFGNSYTVNRASISFYSATKIEPVLDVDLATSRKNVDVVLHMSGPIDNLKLTYRSDPPLAFEDTIALLATGRTPPDATIAAQQTPEADQSALQMGESAVLGQTVANPVASRLERVFGVSQLKIDPTFNTASALPQARISLQQQVSDKITFTYTTDLSQTNAQIIRVQWELSPRFSAVATRDEFGVVGIDFLYRKQFR